MRLLHLSWIRSITLSRASVRFKSQTGSAVTPQAKEPPRTPVSSSLPLFCEAGASPRAALAPAEGCAECPGCSRGMCWMPWLSSQLWQDPAVGFAVAWLVGWLVGEGDCHIFCHYLLSKSALNQFCLNLQNCFFTSSLSHLEASVHLIKIFLFILGAQPVTCHAANSIPAHALLFQ